MPPALSSMARRRPFPPPSTGGLLDTGTIQATTATSVNTNSNISANAFTVGSYTTIPRIVVSGEATSASTFTPGTINALVSGPGGGTATALGILANASVPEIDVLQHGSIAAQITTTTLAPDTSIATTKTPFVQNAVAILDASGTVKTHQQCRQHPGADHPAGRRGRHGGEQHHPRHRSSRRHQWRHHHQQ